MESKFFASHPHNDSCNYHDQREPDHPQQKGRVQLSAAEHHDIALSIFRRKMNEIFLFGQPRDRVGEESVIPGRPANELVLRKAGIAVNRNFVCSVFIRPFQRFLDQ